MEEEKERVGTTHYTLNSISNLRKLKHNHTETISRHRARTKLDRILNEELIVSTELPKNSELDTQLNEEISTKTYSNSFKLMEFGIKTGGVRVEKHFENRIKPIRSYGRDTKSSMAEERKSREDIYQKRPLTFIRQKSSILDKNNLFLVPFLKNKVKRLSKFLEKPKTHSAIELENSSLNLRATPVEYNFRSVPRGSTGVLTSKRYSGLRTHKMYQNEIRL